jgi:putative Mg2+ transporter-C (MgtC) family protein
MDQAIIDVAYKFGGYGMGLFVLITLVISGLLAGIIGFEREMKGQAAGLRTHVLLSVGCSLMMTISIFSIQLALRQNITQVSLYNYDTSRIAAGIIAGIGFLCAGTIIKNGVSVRGLTTAATLWLCGAIGMACGAGFILEAIIATFVALAFLLGLVWIEKWMDKRSPHVRIIVARDVPILNEIHDEADKCRLIVKNIVSDTVKDIDGKDISDITVFFAYKSDTASINDFCESFSSNAKVFQVRSNRFDKHTR